MAEKTETVYTEEVVAAMEAQAPLNWEKAQDIAERFNLKAKGVVASAIRNGIEYKRKERVSKSGAKIVSKADLVSKIAEKIGVDVAKLDGLEKATKTSLETLLG
jgi:wobble nucleotide-excising tRNase